MNAPRRASRPEKTYTSQTSLASGASAKKTASGPSVASVNQYGDTGSKKMGVNGKVRKKMGQ